LKFRGCYFIMATIVVTFASTFPALPEIGETTTKMNSCNVNPNLYWWENHMFISVKQDKIGDYST